jgi:hypothetical protein
MKVNGRVLAAFFLYFYLAVADQCVSYNSSTGGLCTGYANYAYNLSSIHTQSSMDATVLNQYQQLTLSLFTDASCQTAVLNFLCALNFPKCNSDNGVPSTTVADAALQLTLYCRKSRYEQCVSTRHGGCNHWWDLQLRHNGVQ